MSKLTLAILLDAGRHDYPWHMPFVKSLAEGNTYVKKLYNPGGYCERSCFMTGTPPEVSGNMFAMSHIYPGYKRAYYEPTFNVPAILRDRLCMTEDMTPDTEPGSFYNPDTDTTLESIWDLMREENRRWIFQACLALGIRQHLGKTTHGNRAIQLVDSLKNERPDFAYWQISRIDQEAHKRGSDPETMKDILMWADGEIERVFGEAKKLYDEVNFIVFGDHGQTNVDNYVDIPLEYPPYRFGWDYLYLKSSAAIQFWVFNENVEKAIKNDIQLKLNGKFIKSPSVRQGDFIWAAKPGTILSPDHFHPRGDVQASMHGFQLFDPDIDSEKGFVIATGPDKVIEQAELTDVCPTITDLLGLRETKHNQGRSLIR